MPAAALEKHAPAILQRLEDDDSDVRKAAVHVLGQLPAAALETHAPAILQRSAATGAAIGV